MMFGRSYGALVKNGLYSLWYRPLSIIALGMMVLIMLQSSSYGDEYQYTVDYGAISNPDRGWYSYAPILGNADYAQIGNSGSRLVYGAITLKDFIHSDIDSSTLQKISERFAELRSSGVKAVLRVNYNEQETGTDANLSQMVRHMQQLKPLLVANQDVIAYIEMGYFGQWGEWHDWCGGQNNSNLEDDHCSKHIDNQQTWKRIVDELLLHTPKERFLMIRYPGKKRAVLGGGSLAVSEAYSQIGRARVGHHNDCFLASPDDMGTYQTFDNSVTIADLKNYLAEETQYLPMGGETCYATSGDRFDCSDAVAEMERFHWTYLNQDYYEGALNKWVQQGCKNEINRRLGYRFELLSAILPDVLKKGAEQGATFIIHNSGFSRYHYKRIAYLRLFRGEDVLADLPLAGVDLRMVGAGETAEVFGSFTVPEGLTEGPVSVALWLPDVDQRNWGNSRFSIRLAYEQSESDWQQMNSPGHNVLADGVPISDGVTTLSTPEGFRIKSYEEKGGVVQAQ